jgi:hypothetical protein
MVMIPCENHAEREAYGKVHFNNKWLCLDCMNALGDFDQQGKMNDKRIKRAEPILITPDNKPHIDQTKDLYKRESKGKDMSEIETTAKPTETKTTEPQFPGRKCATCGSEKTAKRMSGKERWHELSEKTPDGSDAFQCHKCYEKARKAAPAASS